MICFKGSFPFGAFVKENRNRNIGGTALIHQVAGKTQRPSRFQDVIDEKDVASFNCTVDILDDLHALACGPLAVAGERDELDFRGKAGSMKGPDQIRCKNEGALEDRDDEQIPFGRGCNFICNGLVARRDGVCLKQWFDDLAAYNWHGVPRFF